MYDSQHYVQAINFFSFFLRVSIQKQAQHYSSFDNMSSPQPPVPGHTYAAVKENNSHKSVNLFSL